MMGLLSLLFSLTLASGEMPQEARIWTSESGGTLPYRVYEPVGYNPAAEYPLVLCLHGAGGRGTNNLGLGVTARKILSDPQVQSRYPAFLVTPQCPLNERWVDTPWSDGSYSIDEVPVSDEMLMVVEIVESLKGEFSIDPARVYVTGQSMGGYGTWDVVLRYPHMFAAAIPVCGGGDLTKAAQIAHLPIWAFHGDADPVVPVSASRDMATALEAVDGNILYTEYPGVLHDSWFNAWNEDELVPWLFSQQQP